MPSPYLVLALACGLFGAGVLSVLGVARFTERHNRRLARERLVTLLERWRRYARMEGDRRAIRRQAHACDPALFWSTLENLTLDLTRKEWRRLTFTLGRSRHVTDERWVLRGDSPWRRELAARRLSLIHSPGARRALRRAMQDGPELVAFAAAIGLARQRDAWALRWIFDHPYYFATRPSRARTALLRAFGPGATAALAEKLATGISDVKLERAVIERLGAAGHLPAAPAIAMRLTNAALELRVAAARALGRLQALDRVDALMAALRDERWEVRAQAAHALGRIGASDAVPGLAAALTDPSWWVRRHSAYALARLGAEGAAALSAEAVVSPDRYARDIAREALDGKRVKRPA